MKSKRIWALMGLLYVLFAFCLTTWWIATTTLLRGITGLMCFPLAAALSAQFFNRAWLLRHGRLGHEEDPDFTEPAPQPWDASSLVMGALMGIVSCFLLFRGVQQLLGQLF